MTLPILADMPLGTGADVVQAIGRLPAEALPRETSSGSEVNGLILFSACDLQSPDIVLNRCFSKL
jgi:hypothetical protein